MDAGYNYTPYGVMAVGYNKCTPYSHKKFRFGVSELSVHYYRYRSHVEKDLKCPLCGEAKEDEVHFVLCCPMLDDIRKQFIPPKFCKHPCLFRLSLLLASTNQEIVRKLSIFLYKAFKIRDTVTT